MRCKLVLYITVLTITFPALLQAQSRQDTLRLNLEEIVVTGYESNRSIMETPGAVSFVKTELTGGFDNTSLLYGLNTVPGVRLEQRAPGSYRVAIRGSSLRAPFGVRNVKIYWNDIPFTTPSGSTPLNLLDNVNMKDIEVIRGPAGSIYGAGNGGALLIESGGGVQDFAETGYTFGSYGLSKFDIQSQRGFENGEVRVNYANQQSDGYREQSFFNRETLELTGRFDLDEDQILQASFLYSDLYYGIPGGLTQEQFDEDPTQARPGNPFVLGSVESNASVNQEAFLAGASHDIQLSDRVSAKTTVYGTFSDFENPFNLDYKKDSRKSGGGRTRWYIDGEIGNVDTRIIAGAEYQAASNAARNFGNDFGDTDTLNFDDDIKIRNLLAFASFEADLPGNWYLTAGLSYNRLSYSVDRLIANLEGDVAGLSEQTFDPELVPRIGITKKFSPQLAIHGSISQGFSPPTIEEFRTNEGSINLDLQAERGVNYEAGLRGNLWSGRIQYDLTGFFFKLDETIVQRESDRGTVLFRNAGSTDQWGIELGSRVILIEDQSKFLSRLNAQVSYTYHNFEFNDYQSGTEDYSGNALTGVAPNTLVSILSAETRPGFYSSISWNFTDEIPLNDANTVYSESYNLVQLKAGFRTEIFDDIQLNIYGGIDNLLNETYSLGNDLNAFGARYFQPAAERNFFGGLRLRVLL
ncbi:TonB-dependent receptor family protein [Balneola sp. MJW-20]|uniref:TonB-dependent receptor family protein n=1 Tax=Gracilimonas aurantiaca TaxID=3234185 RepID=UPI0034653485